MYVVLRGAAVSALIATLGLLGTGGHGLPSAAAATRGGLVATSYIATSSPAAVRKPAATLTLTYTSVGDKVRVDAVSNAKLVKLAYRNSKGKKATAKLKISSGAGSRLLPSGSKQVRGRAAATKRLARSPWVVALAPAPPAPAPPAPPPPVPDPQPSVPPTVINDPLLARLIGNWSHSTIFDNYTINPDGTYVNRTGYIGYDSLGGATVRGYYTDLHASFTAAGNLVLSAGIYYRDGVQSFLRPADGRDSQLPGSWFRRYPGWDGWQCFTYSPEGTWKYFEKRQRGASNLNLSTAEGTYSVDHLPVSEENTNGAVTNTMTSSWDADNAGKDTVLTTAPMPLAYNFPAPVGVPPAAMSAGAGGWAMDPYVRRDGGCPALTWDFIRDTEGY